MTTVQKTGRSFSQPQWKFRSLPVSLGVGFVAARGQAMFTSIAPP